MFLVSKIRVILHQSFGVTETIIETSSIIDSATIYNGDFMSEDEDDDEEIVIPRKAEDVMTENVVELDEDASVKRAAEIMAEEGITAIIITKKKKIVGIVTERDILKRVVVREKSPVETKMKDIMSNPLVTIEPNMKLEEAAHLMFEKKIKNLPVMKNKRLVGLVSLQDICKFQPKLLRVLKGLMETPENLERILKCYII